MDCARRLVKRVSGLEQTRRLTIDRKFVCALHHVSKCVVAGVAMRGAGEPRRAVDDAHADFSPLQVGARLRTPPAKPLARSRAPIAQLPLPPRACETRWSL